jgi:hypothetical protein
MLLFGCSRAAWQPRDFGGLALGPGRYLDKCYRNPTLNPAAAVYRVEIFPVEQVSGISQEQAQALFSEELIKAMTANGLRVNQEEPEERRVKPGARAADPQAGQAPGLFKPQKSPEGPAPVLTLSGVVDRLAVASPTWRFFSGRGNASLRVAGEIRREQEVVFAFQDDITINPPVNPKHRPALEADLIARLAIRRFTADFLNELLLPPKNETEVNIPAAAPPER